MAWIYLAESEDSQKPSKGTSRQSPIVKTTDTRNQCFCREWHPAICLSLQSGMTLQHWMVDPSKALKSSMAAFPAKTLALQAAERAWGGAEADYFSRSSGSSAKYDLDSSSWRTSQQLLFEEQSELLANFAASGMTLDGEFYPLRTWVRITKGKGGGALLTPTVNMVSGGGNHNAPTVKAGRHGLNLKGYVMRWPTPTGEPFRSRSGNRKHEMGLDRMAKMWPTPNARDHFPVHKPEYIAKKKAEGHGMSMLNDSVGGQLNPTWVEWLMGYPSEWTVCADWATLWFRPKRAKRLKGLSEFEVARKNDICSDPTCTVIRCVRIRKRSKD